MLTFPADIQTLIAGHCEAYWLAELALPGGTQYYSERIQVTWDGHTWLPLLDPQSPHDGIKYNLKCDEKNETSINLVNTNHAISDLLKTNDFQGCECILYLYFPAASTGAGNAIERFRGVMGKPEEETDQVIVVPVTSRLHGPRTKLPSRVFSRYCGLNFADGVDCPYNPPTIGVVDPGTGLAYTSCPKSMEDCVNRGMFDPLQEENKGYFGGFNKWTCMSHGKLNNTGVWGIGRKSYTSNAAIQDNFLGAAVPLVYGKIRVPGIVYFTVDESEFQLTGAFVGEGQMQGCKEILANNQPTHDFKYPALFWGGYPGQYVPLITGYDADPFCCTHMALIRTKDEVGLQADKLMNVSVQLADPANHASDAYGGRMVEIYHYDGGVLDHAIAFSNDPLDLILDMLCAPRGGLGFDYSTVNYSLLNTDRAYSTAAITDWDGSSRERYTLNAYIADQQPAGDVLEQFRDEFSMVVQDYGSNITLRYIRPTQTSVMTFDTTTNANILHDEDGLPRLVIKEKPLADIPNRLVVSFLDQDNNWEKTTFHLESTQMIERTGKIVDEQIYLRGTTNIGQAMRIASNRMERYISGNWHVEFTSGLMALPVECGDVITVADDKIIDGSDTFLVTSVEITAELEVQITAELFRSDFYDDVVADEYSDHLRGTPDNPLRLPDEVDSLSATEGIVQVDGVNSSEITVTWAYPVPPDLLLKTVEIWWRDTLSPDDSWTRGAVAMSTETSAKFALPIRGYRMLEIRARAVSRYGICRDLDNTDVPEYDLLVDGTLDSNVPDAPTNFQVITRGQDPTVPPGFYRASFDAGATNWAGVHTLYIEANESLPFSDGALKMSGMGAAVSGTGVIDAGGTTIYKENAGWTDHDSALVGCLAIVTDGGGNVQARFVVDNTADTIFTNGPWYLPDGSYSFEVRTDFTKANFRGFLFAASQGDFSPAARTFQFDLPLTDLSLYFRVTAFNAFGKSPWVTTADPVDNYSAIDTTPAPLVTGFTVTPQGYTLPDGTQKVMLNISFTPPDPEGNFSHIIVFADRPSEGVPGKEGEVGWGGQLAHFKELVGEIYESGTPYIMDPDAQADHPTQFMVVSVNKDGWYPTNWVSNGINNPGGFRWTYCNVLPEDTAPPASASVVASYNPSRGIDVVWDTVAIPDLAYWEVQVKKAATEVGLGAASYVTANEQTVTTFSQWFPPDSESGYWYKFQVRAVDNAGNAGTWAESNNIQAYSFAHVQPVAVPINLAVTGDWEYRNGVPLSFISVNWDNPVDPNYGGCQVWVKDYTKASASLYDIVEYDQPSNTLLTLLMDSHVVQILLIPFNKSRVVPDYNTFAASPTWTNDPATFGESVPSPNITARDGIGAVSLQVEIPAWSGMTFPYSNLALYVSKTNNSGNASLVGKWPVGHASGGAERLFIDLTVQDLSAVTGGPWVEGELYYFFGKLESKNGSQSAFSSDSNHSAVFLPGGTTESGAPDFASNAEVMRIVAAEDRFSISWNAPTVNGATVYLSQLQVSDKTDFSHLIRDFSVNAKNGSDVVVVPVPGTYYVRVRYTNHSQAGTSAWFGLRKGDGTAYATVATVAGQSGDTSYIDGATYLAGYYNRIEQSDALQVYFKMSSSATNCATWWNTTILWSATQSKLDDANYIAQGGITASWADYDGWISISGATPASSWIGKVLQWKKNTSPDIWQSGIITQIDAAGGKVQINVNFGSAQTGKTARVVTGYWERDGVYFEEVAAPDGGVLLKNVNYYLQTAVNQIPSPATIYFKMIPHNAVFGPGTAAAFSITTQQKAYDIVIKGQGYANDSAPTGTFASGGYQWVATANNSVDFIKTFSYTQATNPNFRADSFVIVIKSGGGTPDPATDPKLVFPINHTSGAQSYSLKVPNLDPFTTYSFKTYAAKNTASGLILGTGSTLTDSNVIYTTGNDLIIRPVGSGGVVYFYQVGSSSPAIIDAGTVRGNTFLPQGGSTNPLYLSTGSTAQPVRVEYGLLIAGNGGLASRDLVLDTLNSSNPIRSKKVHKLEGGADVTGTITASVGVTIKTAGYQYPLKMGGYYLWVNATSGKLYIKSGAPSSDTDGTIVGTQS